MMCIQYGANPHEQQINCTSLMLHEKYPGTYASFDIAVLRLSKPLVFNDYVQPVCIPTAPVDDGTNCVAIGWGDTACMSFEF